MRQSIASRRGLLLSAVSVVGLALAAAPAAAQGYATEIPGGHHDIVTNDGVTPGEGDATIGEDYAMSPDVLDSGVTGVGMMLADHGDSFGVCTGTLVNPRTVITAAHCVYSAPAHAYGSETGTAGIPVSFGFKADNLASAIAWLQSGYQSRPDMAIYNANQVWYHPDSTSEFALGDVALVTLDTHAQDIPTWAMLFSPLQGKTHATIVGYGGAGVGLSGIGDTYGIDFRRRAAENMIDALMSSHDWASSPSLIPLGGGPGFTGFIEDQHSMYWFDFDDPNWSQDVLDREDFFNNTAGEDEPDNGYYDYNGLGGESLEREGGTAGGDSGGPLIVDRQFTDADGNYIPVIAGVLTGGYSFGGSTYYGDFSVYPPLYLYWEQIVQNNPYKYVSAKAGNGDWFDPNHWVQDMDPNYMVIGPDGQLVNTLPSINQLDQDDPSGRFGTTCFAGFLCSEISGPAYDGGDGPYVVTAGGPGSTGFVPNNVEPVNSANAAQQVQARYYDVTLSRAGTTTLSQSAQIDKLTIDGAAKLDIRSTGNLGVWADFEQWSGWTNVDGTLRTDDALVVTGLLTGKGTFDPTYLTVVAGMVAPGGEALGNLTVKGDVILASASALNISVAPEFSDKLIVQADPTANTSGVLALNGGSVLFTRAQGVHNPKYGGTWVIASAEGGVDGKFGFASAGQGVVKVKLTYTPNDVIASLSASSFTSILKNPTGSQLAFAHALDALRDSSSTGLWNLYSNIDWVNGDYVAATFDALTPRIVGDVDALQNRQSRLLMNTVGDRLSLLASGKAKGLSMVGDLTAAFQARSQGVQSGGLGFGASNGGAVALGKLPGRMTGFVAGGIDRSTSSYGGRQAYNSQGGWHMAMGLEMPLGAEGAFGTAAGFAEGESSPNGDHNVSRTTMAAAYASMPLGKGFYVGGLVSAESSRASTDRTATDGSQMLRLSGATDATRYSAVAEAGFATGIGRGLTLTPRAQLGYSRYNLSGFTEEGGETALQLDDVTVSRVEARLGAKLEGETRFAGVKVVPQLSADYVSLLSGRKMGATVRFAVAPDQAFHLPLAESDAGWAEVRGGLTFGDGPLTLGLSGQHATGGAMIDQRAQADLKFRF